MVEPLVAAGLLGIMFLALYAGVSAAFATINSARQGLRATQVALEKMETMRMYSWDQVNSNGFIPPTFTASFFPSIGGTNDSSSGNLTYYGTTVITNTPITATYSNDMRLVIVTVNWTNSGRAYQRKMQTYISQYGMQRYIY